MTIENKEKLEKYLLKILRNEIIIADESYFILKTINDYWNQISVDGYNLFFKSTYSAYFIRFSLAITKLFDKPSKKYETVSIPYVIQFLYENFMDSTIQERPNLNKQFSLLGYDYTYLNRLSDCDINKIMIEHFQKYLPSDDYTGDVYLSRILETIKLYRDKHYSHSENVDIENMPKTTFEDSLNLLLFAKQFVSIFSLAYLNMFHSYDGIEYVFTNDAKMTNTSFKRILRKAGLIV